MYLFSFLSYQIQLLQPAVRSVGDIYLEFSQRCKRVAHFFTVNAAIAPVIPALYASLYQK